VRLCSRTWIYQPVVWFSGAVLAARLHFLAPSTTSKKFGVVFTTSLRRNNEIADRHRFQTPRDFHFVCRLLITSQRCRRRMLRRNMVVYERRRLTFLRRRHYNDYNDARRMTF